MPTLIRALVASIAFAFALAANAQLKSDKPSGTGLKPKPAAGAESKPAADPKAEELAVEKIFGCIATGLPQEWRRAWVVITELSGGEKDRKFEGKFEYSVDPAGKDPKPLVTCNAREVAEGVYKLNEFLQHDKRQWKTATLVFTSDGKFEIKYDYVK